MTSNMLRPAIVVIALLFSGMLAAQGVGINNPTPDASALLDLTSTGKGLLLPRMTTAQRNAIAAPATSLLIFNTSNARYEYFDGLAWVPLVAGGWSLTGNAGTDPATNSIGTTDAQSLRFRVNNEFAGHIANTSTGQVSLGLNAGAVNSATRNTFIGSNAGLVNTTGASNTFLGQGAGAANTTTSNNTYVGTGAGQTNATGQQNVYIGRLAGGNGTSGSDNILIGNGAGISNTANNNVMIGSFSGNANSTGGGNTFLGTQSGQSTTTGGQNTFIGTGAGGTNITGSQNTLIGNGASLNANNLTNATAIGRASRVDVSDGFVLGSVTGINGATTTSRVGIGTTNPAERLHLVGSIRMVDGNQAAGRVMVSDANGTASWAAPGTTASGTLDQAYDFGGAGAGRTITADAGAVTIAGNDGLVSTGTSWSGGGIGALVPSGAGVRMVWNPRRAAIRAGVVTGVQWDNANVGLISAAWGEDNYAFGTRTMAWGYGNAASGQEATVWGRDNAANGFQSTAWGRSNTAVSFGETVLGIGATTYFPSTNGFLNFQASNATDRVLTVGNAIDANSNGLVDDTERSDALVILKNGNTGIGVSAPSQRMEVAGRSLFHNGFSADNAALLYRSNTDYMFLGPQSGSSANGAAIALYGSTNASGGNTNGMDVNVPNGRVRFNHTGGQFEFRTNSTSGYTGFWELNDQELRMGHNSTGRAIVIHNGFGERFRIDPNGNVGINTGIAAARLHVQGNIRIADGTQAAGRILVSDANGTATWQALTAAGLGGWSLTGNAGTVPGTSFLGTTDNQPLVLRTNYAERVRVVGTGEVGIGTAAPATWLHVNGGISATPVTATATANPFNYAPGDRTYVRMGSNNTPLNRFVVLGNGLTPGQVLIIECTATGTSGLTFADGANLNVGGTKQLLSEDSITFIWNGTKWILTSYADN